ncbi:hypothetical protein [Rhizobium sp. HT1-10]|uniref:hypothetical protein n=1 Tax=Rhizobium sp. HT1-10 TaxID=3111638 RepID=UPI003C1D4AA1
MSEILAKISSYDIFNNLVPGAILAFLLAVLEIYTIDTNNIVVDLVVFYFLGVVVSRIGSLISEPILRVSHFVRYAEYSAFIAASQKDEKIAVLLEVNNQYRTFIALMLVTITSYFGRDTVLYYGFSDKTVKVSLVAGTAVLFVLAYRKQTSFIKKRVEYQNKQ